MKYKIQIEELINKGLNAKEIAKELGVSYSGLRYWLRILKLKPNKHKSSKWNEELLKKLIKESHTKSEVLRKMNLLVRPGNFRTFDRYVEKYKIAISHFDVNFYPRNLSLSYTNEALFKENSTYSNGRGLKVRILKEGKEYKCEICFNKGIWNNGDLKLQIDHINGINNDNRLENLRFLCPNCHSQTKTFCSKNRKGDVQGVA